MKALQLCIAGLLVPMAAFAGSAPSPEGSWAVPGLECPFALELTAGHITRTTGTLIYSTKVTLVQNGEGWLLDEQLDKSNDGVSCKGEKAAVVTDHLKQKAYIEVNGDTLYYFRSKGEPLAHSFVRRGT
jgi:hypothetical protein